jgi:hypothetical protein
MRLSVPGRATILAALATAAAGSTMLAQPPLLDEQFESGSMPAGWSVIDNAGQGAVWLFDNPGGLPNDTGGAGQFVVADSDYAGFVDVDTSLVTPVIDLSGATDVSLRFQTTFVGYQGGGDVTDEVADVDLSINFGTTWTNVFRHTEADGDLFARAIQIPLPQADNQAGVRLRFHYYNAYYDYWWVVDNVRVETDRIFADGFGG